MIPSIWPGDILLVRRITIGEISRGEVVLCERDGKLRAHRVVEIRGAGPDARIVTQGEALPELDPEISESQLLGRVAAICRDGAWRELKARPGLGIRILSGIVRRSSFAARVSLHFHAKRGQGGAPAPAGQPATTWGT